ncbi:MAG: DUF2790 domain-containing protein [Methylophilaceae bacterium]
MSAYAQEAIAPPKAVSFAYGMSLNIAKVMIGISPAANVCAAKPDQMTYRDSQGETHVLEYSVLGTGCSN